MDKGHTKEEERERKEKRYICLISKYGHSVWILISIDIYSCYQHKHRERKRERERERDEDEKGGEVGEGGRNHNVTNKL